MKKKYKRAGTTSERQDYRKGGLVGDSKRVKVYGGGGVVMVLLLVHNIPQL